MISGSEDTTWPGTQYWAKAEIWNRYPRIRLSLDDVVQMRVAAMTRSKMKTWKKHCDRDYDVVFANRVRKAINHRMNGKL